MSRAAWRGIGFLVLVLGQALLAVWCMVWADRIPWPMGFAQCLAMITLAFAWHDNARRADQMTAYAEYLERIYTDV